MCECPEHIVHWDAKKDGELNEANFTKKLQAKGYKVEKMEFPAGKDFGEHSHGEDNTDAVLSGELEVKMCGKSFHLKAGDMLHVAKNLSHSAKVLGGQKLVLLDGTK